MLTHLFNSVTPSMLLVKFQLLRFGTWIKSSLLIPFLPHQIAASQLWLVLPQTCTCFPLFSLFGILMLFSCVSLTWFSSFSFSFIHFFVKTIIFFVFGIFYGCTKLISLNKTPSKQTPIMIEEFANKFHYRNQSNDYSY